MVSNCSLRQNDQSFVSRLLFYFQNVQIRTRMKTLGFLFLFLLAFPITLFITIVTLIIHFIKRQPLITNPNGKRILVSSGGMTKALQLVRSLYLSGHQIILTEEYSYTAHRFSRYVTRFCRCADTKNSEPYIQSIIDIVKREKIDIFIPVSHSWNECADSLVKKALVPLNCEMFHGELDQLQMLSNKYEFINRARSLGLSVPKTYKITNPKQVLEFDFSQEKSQYILKSLGDDTVTRWNRVKFPRPTRQETIDFLNTITIDEENPWLLQEFIPGKEYCTHGTVYNGELRLYTCCESSPWCLRYKHDEDKKLILQWVQEFTERANLTGQASFDFIESSENGRPYAIECNPRTHTAITAFYNNPRVAEAYLDKKSLTNGPIKPYPNAREVYWLHQELWNLFKIRSIEDLIRQLKIFINGKEAIHSIEDPWPFFFQYTVHMPLVLFYNLLDPVPYEKVDCNLGLLL